MDRLSNSVGRLVLATFGVLFLWTTSATAADLDFNVASGNYTAAGNWVDATTGAPAAAAPTLGDNVFVRNNGTLTINSDVGATLIRIGSEKTVTSGEPPVDTQVGMGGTLVWTAGEITGVEGFHMGGPDLRVGRHINLSATQPVEYDFPGTVTQNGATTKILLKNPESRITIGDSGSQPSPLSSYTLVNGVIGLAVGGSGLDGANSNNGINVRNGTFTMTGGQIIDATPQDLIDGGVTTQRFMTVSSNGGTAGSENYSLATFSGGSVNVLGGLRVAPSSNSFGRVNINGPVTIVTGGDTSIGYNANNGVGELNMSAGSYQVGRTDLTGLTGRLQIGHRGKGTLNMSGGSISVTREIRVGAELAAGGSAINMTGGSITTPALNMGVVGSNTFNTSYAGASIILDGPAAAFTHTSAANTSAAIIGDHGKALFEVRQGTAVLGGGGNVIQIGNTADSEPTINVKGGKLTLGGTLTRTILTGPAPVIGLTGGTLEFNNPSTAAAQGFQANLTNTGSKLIAKPSALLQVNVGSVSPAIPASFAMSSGSWDIDIGAHAVLGADWFNAPNGTASLTGGTLNINYLPGFTPNDNEVFRILRGGLGVTLTSGAVTIAGAGAGHWMLQTVPISGADAEIQLKYIASVGVSGDYNGNGVVDAADYVLWRNGGPLQNDPTPGVQAADYDYWRSRFGATSGAGTGLGAASAAVPEPSCVALAVFTLLGWFATSKRNRNYTELN
ncbi:MAG: hypothetical protein U0805_11170 [Pirellulales bacterium]